LEVIDILEFDLLIFVLLIADIPHQQHILGLFLLIQFGLGPKLRFFLSQYILILANLNLHSGKLLAHIIDILIPPGDVFGNFLPFLE
jgi:hypothetical protein